jgi:hypothetical protein
MALLDDIKVQIMIQSCEVNPPHSLSDLLSKDYWSERVFSRLNVMILSVSWFCIAWMVCH